MTTTQLKRNITKRISKLPPKKLAVVNDFVKYLSDAENINQATKELYEIPGLEEEIAFAKKEFKENKGVNWRKVRNDI
ncbi:MAG: hypothetical protein ACRDFC_03290 [Ignavibacteria bacterium]